MEKNAEQCFIGTVTGHGNFSKQYAGTAMSIDFFQG